MSDIILYSTIATVSSLFVALYFRGIRTAPFPLPPGPPKWPIVGNLFDIPAGFRWEKYMEWGKKYDSDIIHLNVVGTPIIVLNSVEAANDLLAKRSAIYSDRPRLTMFRELMGWDWVLGFMNYGTHWRAQRRLVDNAFGPKGSLSFRPHQRAVCNDLLRRLLDDPDGYSDHIRHVTGALIVSTMYGIKVLEKNDPYIITISDAIYSIALSAAQITTYLVDAFPILKHVPEWFPGAGFKRQAKIWKKLTMDAADVPFAEMKRQIEMGTASHSFAASNLANCSDSVDKAQHEELVKFAAGSMYIAAVDTTVGAVDTFVRAMLNNPDVQRKAQAEIDRVVGTDRLPDFQDRASLPYVTAVINEVLRWHSTLPFGVPHFVAVEDVYRGYRIPAGSTVLSNLWAMSRDENIFPDAYTFKPERYLLDDGTPNPDTPVFDFEFGFGRRICPGRHMALSSLHLSIASILFSFNISKAVGDNGEFVKPSDEFLPGDLVLLPRPSKCSITPRSSAAVELILATSKAKE
ncbi:cytochrome P450 [Mycena capillaripes]|nr:cytochrome P450 [Mycena capillaripes]